MDYNYFNNIWKVCQWQNNVILCVYAYGTIWKVLLNLVDNFDHYVSLYNKKKSVMLGGCRASRKGLNTYSRNLAILATVLFSLDLLINE